MKAIKRAIILCWIMLIVCFIIKLFGGNWFEIICNNKHFINICNYIDTHIVLSYFLALPVYIISTGFVLLACCLIKKPNLKQLLTILLFMLAVWATQFISQILKQSLEIVMFLVLPFITRSIEVGFSNWKTTTKKTWYLGIIGYGLALVFQVLSLLTRNIGIKVVGDNTLISLILMFDYCIMAALYYLYIILNTKKEKENG